MLPITHTEIRQTPPLCEVLSLPRYTLKYYPSGPTLSRWFLFGFDGGCRGCGGRLGGGRVMGGEWGAIMRFGNNRSKMCYRETTHHQVTAQTGCQAWLNYFWTEWAQIWGEYYTDVVFLRHSGQRPKGVSCYWNYLRKIWLDRRCFGTRYIYARGLGGSGQDYCFHLVIRI